MNETVLVVDDEREIADLVTLYLRNEDYSVYPCYTAAEALEVLRDVTPDLAVLDIMLPDMSGLELCRIIRESAHYPIIMLTAKDEEMDKITGLTLGADDYMTKPFRPLELVARVKAQLRRYTRYNTPAAEKSGVLSYRGLVLDAGSHICRLNEQPLDLTPTEFSILQTLLERQGTVVGAEELFYTVWGEAYYNKNNNTITVHIRHLREKLGDTSDRPRYIKTVWGVGYKIEQ